MKKLLSLILLLPSIANAWESSVGVGAYHRRFDSKDQLGTAVKEEPLKLNTAAGLALNGSFLFSASSIWGVGSEASLAYGWAEKKDSQVASVMIGPSIQYGDRGFSVALIPSFAVNILTDNYKNKIDADTG